MNNFQKSSLVEREKLTALYTSKNITEFDFTDSKGVDRYDSTFKSFDQDFIVECKVRANSSTKYPTTLIEKSKVEFLIEKAKETNATPLLVVFYNDGKYSRYNLNKLGNVRVEQKYCNRTTAVDSGKKMKEVYLLPINNTNTFTL
jgi:hypothetical protein